MEKILAQNNKCTSRVKKNGNDSNPENKASLGRKGKGPLSRNFDSPKADENRLRKKVATGNGERLELASPSTVGGKKP
jgi:hypothetical protein